MLQLKRFLPYYKHLKPVRWQFALGVAFGGIYSVLSGLGLPVIAETIFPIVFEGPEKAPDWIRSTVPALFGNSEPGSYLVFCCLLIPAIGLARGLSSVGNGYFMSSTGIRVVQALQIDMFGKIQSMPLAFFGNYNTGRLISSIKGYPSKIKSVVVDMSNDIIRQPLTLIAATSYVIYKSFLSDSVFIAVIAMVSFALLVIPIHRIGLYLAKRSRQMVLYNEELQSTTIESIQSPLEIRAYNLQSSQMRRFQCMLGLILRLSLKTVRRSLLISPTIELVATCGIGLALFLGAKSGMEQSEFVALVIALYVSYKPIKSLAGMHSKLKRLEAPLSRMESVMAEVDTVPEPKDPVEMKLPVKGGLEFKEVEFDYVEGRPVLHGVSVTIHPGETVALVGRSGAGKSSFVNLVPRFYDVGSGSVSIDGVDVRELNVKKLRSQIAYVPQMPMLFHASVMDNIRVGRPKASDEEVIQAARDANALSFIEDLPEGMETVVTERGKSLSGGQRQRIAIARAFLKDAPILILDEATSALDNETDREIGEALHRLFEYRTTLIIAHRMSTLRNVGRRLFFHDGRLVADGGHEELLRESERYRIFVEAELLSEG